jgi:hypothetical protein
MRMVFGAIGGIKFGRGNRSTRRKPTPAPLCPPQNPTWQTRSRTLDHSAGKPATNRLIYGAAFFIPISSPLTTRRFTVEVFDPASTRVFLDPKYGGEIFFRNVGWLSTDYTALYPRRQNYSKPLSQKPQFLHWKHEFMLLNRAAGIRVQGKPPNELEVISWKTKMRSAGKIK